MLLEVKNLEKRYKSHMVLKRISFCMAKGEVLGILGPNGAGKSTLLSILSGIMPYDSGKVMLYGMNISSSNKLLKSRIGIVPQEICLYPDLTGSENLRFFGGLYGFKGRTLESKVNHALYFTGMDEYKDLLVSRYSGGMKRRLNIACGIVHDPEFIILDEPTVGVDIQSRCRILQCIHKLTEKGASLIYTSHNFREASAICTRLLIMDSGKIIYELNKHNNEFAEYKLEEIFFRLSKLDSRNREDLKWFL